jgi:hypothetical protein
MFGTAGVQNGKFVWKVRLHDLQGRRNSGPASARGGARPSFFSTSPYWYQEVLEVTPFFLFLIAFFLSQGLLVY